MIYLINTTTGMLIGIFDSISLAKQYLNGIGIITYENYLFLMRVEDMKYISRICYVDGICIYNNKTFWTTQAQSVLENYNNHVITDFLGAVIYIDQFKREYYSNGTRLGMIHTTADAVNYNIDIGFEFITLFREECVNADLGSLNGLDIASKTANLIPLVMTGSFKEALKLLNTYTIDEYFTTDRLEKYKAMIGAADVITYQS